jgi:DNA-binding NtrC family response regulator
MSLNETPASRRGVVAVVEDDATTRQIIRAWLSPEGHEVIELPTGAEGIARAADVDLMCLDLGLDDMDGLEVLRRVRAEAPEVTVIVVTGNRQIETAVEAMRMGAYDYVTKPLERDAFLAIVGRANERAALRQQVRELCTGGRAPVGEIIGESPAIRDLTAQIERVLDSDIAVCVQGESGTGKELVARAIHRHGRRKKGPFVAINCAAIPESLQESELFGHERGAFTGAIGTHKGRVEQAHGGTLFLDEIGEMSPQTQAALLRTLQEKTIRRVGGAVDIAVNVRVVCATHRDLELEVREGRFREDLYFRLVVYPLTVPPLRARKTDIPLLVSHMLRALRDDVGRDVTSVSPDALDALMRHHWPGNVRELRNVVHRAMVSCPSSSIELAHLPASLREAAPPSTCAAPPVTAIARGVPTIRQLEHDAIVQALTACGGSVTKAAKLLGLGRATLYRRLAANE